MTKEVLDGYHSKSLERQSTLAYQSKICRSAMEILMSAFLRKALINKKTL